MEEVDLLATSADPLLACCLCRCLLREAVQLSCLHNCCQQCFSTAASSDNRQIVACVSCGTVTQAGSQQPNSFIDHQVQRYKLIAESSTCGVCRGNGDIDKPALMWCSTCRHSLCGDCIAGHRQYYRQHVTLSLEELSVEEMCFQPPFSVCAIHRKPLDIACLNCEQAKCISCWAECKEKKHEVHIVGEQSFDIYVGKVIAAISSIESELLRKSEVLERPMNILTNTRASRDRHLEEISQRKRRIVDAVEKAYEQIAFSTKNAYDDLEAEGHAAAVDIERIASSLSDARNYIRRLLDSNDKCEILNQQKIVQERLSVLSAELDCLNYRLATTMREVKLNNSLPEDLEDVFRAWIGWPLVYSVSSSSAPPPLQPQVYSFGSASSSVQLRFECSDVALSQNGCRLLLAAGENGLIELCSATGRELSRWRPPKLSNSKDDLAQGVAALRDGRAAVGILGAKLVVLLRRSENGGGGDAWTEDRRLDQLPWPPRRLSAHGDVLAVSDDKRDEKQNRWFPGSRLQLMSVSSGRRLSCERRREYSIRSLAVAARVVVTGSLGKLSVGLREARVLDAHSVADEDERMWRYVLSSSDSDEITYGVCADSTGGCLYAALLRSDLSGGRVSALSLADGSELRRVALGFDGPQLLPVLLSLSDETSMPSSTPSSCGRTLLLAALCWDPKTKQQRTVTVHRAER